jgi:hypothetical protein
MKATLQVRDRTSLFAALATEGDTRTVKDCMCAYSPPAERLIIRSASDFARLDTTMEAVHGAADTSFWAYADFESVFKSFSLEPSDPERRVMGIEGIGSADALAAAIASGEKPLHIGHLSLVMMQGKVANGEWRWINEGGCVMHTATPKPGLLRGEVRSRLGLELVVRRHEAFLGAAIGADARAKELAELIAAEQRDDAAVHARGPPLLSQHLLDQSAPAAPESVGDLIIFDMDKADVTKPTGNTKVFCQTPANFTIAAFDSLSSDMRAAVDAVLARELVFRA